MIKISLLHPSFNHLTRAKTTYGEYLSRSDNPHEIEYLLSLDTRDDSSLDYVKWWKEKSSAFGREVVNIGEPGWPVGAINRAAANSTITSWLLVLMTDDYVCPEHWDSLLLSEIADINPLTTERYVGVNDGVSNMDFLSIPIITRAVYVENGYVLYPEYRFYRADDDIMWYSLYKGIVKDAPHILFHHRHWTLDEGIKHTTTKSGLGVEDDMQYGWNILMRRKKEMRERFGIVNSPYAADHQENNADIA